jgi:hypothetical protein
MFKLFSMKFHGVHVKVHFNLWVIGVIRYLFVSFREHLIFNRIYRNYFVNNFVRKASHIQNQRKI